MNVIQVNRVSGNAVPAVRQALSRVRAGEENLIRFEKGSYHFFKDGTFLPHLRVSTCKHAVISGNIIRNATIVVDDLYDYWYESGAVEDLEISGNTFCETGGRPAIVVRSCRKGEHSKKHRKVTVVGNRFNQPQSEAVEISAVEESVLTGNRFSDESDNRTAQG